MPQEVSQSWGSRLAKVGPTDVIDLDLSCSDQQLHCQNEMDQSDLEEEASLSQPRADDSPPHRREKLRAMARREMAHSNAPDPDVPMSSTASSSTAMAEVPALSPPSRTSVFTSATSFENWHAQRLCRESSPAHAESTQAVLERDWGKTKRGRCEQCFYSLAPHLYGSGYKAGQIWLLCSRFQKRGSQGERLCFWSMPVPANRWDDLPRWMRYKWSQLPAALRRNSIPR
jgi:hypothetical protein